jgi:DNA-directed RNA polymerase specialized sigma24 family protein
MLATGGSDNDDRDYEVEALLHRTIAESLWDRHPLLAFQQLAKSLFYAYSFTGIPDEPDEYTRTFYRECVDCVTRRIFELTNGNPKEGRRACDAFVAFWTPHWDPPGVQPAQRSSSIDALLEKRSKDLALCLFPPEPSDRDLESGRSYAKGVRAIHEALHPDLDQRIKMLGRDGLASRMRARFTRQPDAPAAQVDLNVPNWPTEAPELFESDSDLAWPDHWRTFPPRWRELGADDATKDEIASIVHRATEDLPEMWRTVLARREFDGWSHQDVARRLGISRADQSLMLHHSRACIRRVLADYLSEEQE